MSDHNSYYDAIDPFIVTRPDKWVTPMGLLNPNNPLNSNSPHKQIIVSNTTHAPYVPSPITLEEKRATNIMLITILIIMVIAVIANRRIK